MLRVVLKNTFLSFDEREEQQAEAVQPPAAVVRPTASPRSRSLECSSPNRVPSPAPCALPQLEKLNKLLDEDGSPVGSPGSPPLDRVSSNPRLSELYQPLPAAGSSGQASPLLRPLSPASGSCGPTAHDLRRLQQRLEEVCRPRGRGYSEDQPYDQAGNASDSGGREGDGRVPKINHVTSSNSVSTMASDWLEELEAAGGDPVEFDLTIEEGPEVRHPGEQSQSASCSSTDRAKPSRHSRADRSPSGRKQGAGSSQPSQKEPRMATMMEPAQQPLASPGRVQPSGSPSLPGTDVPCLKACGAVGSFTSTVGPSSGSGKSSPMQGASPQSSPPVSPPRSPPMGPSQPKSKGSKGRQPRSPALQPAPAGLLPSPLEVGPASGSMSPVSSGLVSPQSGAASPNGEAQQGGAWRNLPKEYRHGHVPKTVNLEEEFKNAQQNVPITTLMIRNIPNRYTQRELIAELEDLGFVGAFDFLYIPLDKGTMSNVGYAFVNFTTSDWAQRCMAAFQNYRFKRHRKISSKIAAVSVAHIQGLEANLAHYENAAVNTAKLKQRRPVVMANISLSLEGGLDD